jgi:hypothetical protein
VTPAVSPRSFARSSLGRFEVSSVDARVSTPPTSGSLPSRRWSAASSVAGWHPLPGLRTTTSLPSFCQTSPPTGPYMERVLMVYRQGGVARTYDRTTQILGPDRCDRGSDSGGSRCHRRAASRSAASHCRHAPCAANQHDGAPRSHAAGCLTDAAGIEHRAAAAMSGHLSGAELELPQRRVAARTAASESGREWWWRRTDRSRGRVCHRADGPRIRLRERRVDDSLGRRTIPTGVRSPGAGSC